MQMSTGYRDYTKICFHDDERWSSKKKKVYPFGWSSGQEEVQVLSSEISKDVNAHRHRAWL